MTDRIDAAVAAASEPEQATEDHTELTVTISSTGRHVVISFPVNATDSELLEFIGWMGSNLRVSLAAARAAQSLPKIEVARVVPRPRQI